MSILQFIWQRPLLLLLTALLLGGGLGWLYCHTGTAPVPELTRAERAHLERQSLQLATDGAAHYATANNLLHDPIPAGDSLRRLAAFDSTVATW